MSPRLRARTARGPEYSTILKFLAFVALTGLLTVFIGQQILGTSFAGRYRLTATFDDVTGLLEGDAVKVAGTPVGQVKSIEVVRGKAVVGMDVDDEVRLPDDSTAAIRWRNVVGQRVVYLEPGQSRGRLGDGDRVPRTRSVVDLGDIVNSLGPLTRNLDPTQLNKILFAFSQALDGNEQNIGLLTDNLDALLRTFAARRKTIQGMIDNYETVSRAVATRDRQIAASVDNLESLTKVFAGNRRLLENAVVEISGVTTNLNQVLGGNDAQLARIIANLGRFSATFRLNVDQLERMVQHLPLTLRQLFASANGGHYLRTNALCLNLAQGPCPFPMQLPRSPGAGRPSTTDLARLKAMLAGGGG
ncbi:MCE family protein [Actinomadura macra]|uniref:MCE family protein n=1 Tax=Actinomadura macra TaxID=46164 RepID=UPI000AE47727|nr:MCE family protein [Actinomadura macra]